MTYRRFCETLTRHGWTLAELRCDVPPSAELLAFMAEVGLAAYERYVTLWERRSQARRPCHQSAKKKG